ncbi:MAG: trehalose-phosphatase [Candidatus Sumerlaeaceae bacterium]|nr:trehalose-phosphatase [Candidatus Sumerlaeaceae bacterium]
MSFADPLASPPLLGKAELDRLCSEFRAAKRPMLFFDYDGTLIEFEADAQRHQQDPRLARALRRLAERRPGCLYVISGRARGALGPLFEGTGVGLIAEHGAYLREDSAEWVPLADARSPWMETVRREMEAAKEHLPAAHVEQKEFSVVFHYRRDDSPAAAAVADALAARIVQLPEAAGFQMIRGHQLVEVRDSQLSKAVAARLATAMRADFILAAGDDRTDEDMFVALGESAWTIRVGSSPSHARWSLPDVPAVVSLLERLAAG